MQQASSQASRHNSPLLEPRKVLISVLLGLAGFAGAFFSPQFSVPPLTLSILWSYTIPLLAAMAYGGRYGLIAGLVGGALYPFFLWDTYGWANAITAAGIQPDPVALAYQFGYLILPAVTPIALWLGLNRDFIESLVHPAEEPEGELPGQTRDTKES